MRGSEINKPFTLGLQVHGTMIPSATAGFMPVLVFAQQRRRNEAPALGRFGHLAIWRLGGLVAQASSPLIVARGGWLDAKSNDAEMCCDTMATMNRLLTKLAIFLLAGAIINVAVAWGFAIQWKSKASVGLSDRSHYSQHSAHNEFSVGLPLRSLTGHRDSGLWSGEKIEGFWIISRSPPNWDMFLPYIPLWPGFAINTIFYAAIVWALFAVPGYIKRRRRIKRSLCVKCAYPLGVTEVCSECGTPVNRRSAVHGALIVTTHTLRYAFAGISHAKRRRTMRRK